MAQASPGMPLASPAGVARLLCVVVLVLMAGAGVYGAVIAVRYFGSIGV